MSTTCIVAEVPITVHKYSSESVENAERHFKGFEISAAEDSYCGYEKVESGRFRRKIQTIKYDGADELQWFDSPYIIDSKGVQHSKHVTVFIMSTDKKVLLTYQYKWGFPKGHVNYRAVTELMTQFKKESVREFDELTCIHGESPEETPVEAVMRETLEETGITIDPAHLEKIPMKPKRRVATKKTVKQSRWTRPELRVATASADDEYDRDTGFAFYFYAFPSSSDDYERVLNDVGTDHESVEIRWVTCAELLEMNKYEGADSLLNYPSRKLLDNLTDKC